MLRDFSDLLTGLILLQFLFILWMGATTVSRMIDVDIHDGVLPPWADIYNRVQ